MNTSLLNCTQVVYPENTIIKTVLRLSLIETNRDDELRSKIYSDRRLNKFGYLYDLNN